MNVLQITYSDIAGQRFNGYQIHKNLLKFGHESNMAVNASSLYEPFIHQVGNRITRKIDYSIIIPLEEQLSIRCILPISSLSLYFSSYYQNADIIHLHLIHGDQFFSLLNIPFMSRNHKIVWTLHDAWILSGHCIHSFDCNRWLKGCGKCPDLTLLAPIKHDTTAFQWKLKYWVMHHSEITLVVASRWMYERVQSSPILSHLPCHIIPFGLDLDVFRPKNPIKCRSRFGIPKDAYVFAFRYYPIEDRTKGLYWIEKALSLLELDKPAYLLVFQGKGQIEGLRDKYKIIELGWVNDQEIIVDALNAADIFLMPSEAESFGMMAIESMACGTPVIVFEGTALSDVIHVPHGGIAAPYCDYVALAQSITKLLKDRTLYENIVNEGLRIVQQEYDSDLYIQRHIDLYKSLL